MSALSCSSVGHVRRSPLDEGPYREGFLDFVKRNKLPLDFFTWMWFTDDSRDPLDFRTVATQLRGILDAHGFETTELLLAYWNMTGIPNAQFTDADAAAFQAAAAVYMQDSADRPSDPLSGRHRNRPALQDPRPRRHLRRRRQREREDSQLPARRTDPGREGAPRCPGRR